MSHFTHIQSHFQNVFYLEKALNKLNIPNYREQKVSQENENSQNLNINLVIPQSNGYNLTFAWNKKEYELISDMSFWDQPCPIESFMNKITQQYVSEILVGESEKTGFNATHYQLNTDGSSTLVLERWNDNSN